MRSVQLNYGFIASHADADDLICNKIPLEERNVMEKLEAHRIELKSLISTFQI